MIEVDTCIRHAIQAGACREEIRAICACTDVMNHEDAPYWAYWYAMNVIKGRWLEAEDIIARCGTSSFWYARLIGPFPAGEAAIATASCSSYWYAVDVLKGPFPAGEAAIAASQFNAAYRSMCNGWNIAYASAHV